jgi:hypothetical protein
LKTLTGHFCKNTFRIGISGGIGVLVLAVLVREKPDSVGRMITPLTGPEIPVTMKKFPSHSVEPGTMPDVMNRPLGSITADEFSSPCDTALRNFAVVINRELPEGLGTRFGIRASRPSITAMIVDVRVGSLFSD